MVRMLSGWLGMGACLLAGLLALDGPARGADATSILETAGVAGGLVVHLGCGDGRLTAALRAGEAYVVRGLDTDAANVAKARAHIRSLGRYGSVTADRFDGRHLPYIDGLVNLVVAERLGDVPMAEVLRVLCPHGVAYVQRDGKWAKTAKPWPDGMDDWTHYLHDPQGTMVGRDRIVGLPRRLQWESGPKWLRNHDFMSSLNGLVSARGRIFSIIDEGLRAHIYLPPRWAVVAQDGFNGTVLWKRRIDPWFPHTFPFKSGPGHLPRRIVAAGDRVYVTLGLTAPLTVLDAATGKTLRTCDDTKATEEILLAAGVLFLAVDPGKQPLRYKHASSSRGKERDRANRDFGWSKQSPPRLVMAVEADSGKTLWRHRGRVAPLTLAVGGQRVYFHDGEHVVALDRGTGKAAWVSQSAGEWAVPATGYAPRLIVGDGVVVLSTKKAKGGRLVGLSAASGKILWRAEQPKSGHFSPEDLFLIDGVLWSANTGGSQSKGTRFVGVDAKTGETRHDFVAEQLEAFFMHQRCYPGRATVRYLMASGTGTEFLELGTTRCTLHHWLRGSCIYGIMPCNGLIYKPPDSCACYYQSKLAHFCALAPAASKRSAARPAAPRLERGPAYGASPDTRHSTLDTSTDWATYRHDNERSGGTPTPVPAQVEQRWRTELGGRLSSLTAAGGKLFVAAIDRHEVHALAAESGKGLWSFAAGGRVDSPPTVVNGRVLFGCADGWVYCLRASDGALAWRYRAAPGEGKLASYGQVESVWPLHGTVLVRDGVAHCLAGRNAFLDGGMRLVRLACATGERLSETVLDDKDPRTGKDLQTLIAGKSMPVANAGVLSCDGTGVYMGAQRFGFDGERAALEVVRGKERDQAGEGRHLFCPTGFLDGWWFHRSYYMYGKNAGEGHGEYGVPRKLTPVGRLMVLDAARVYGFLAHNVGNNINPRTYYSVYAADRNAAAAPAPAPAAGKAGRKARRERRPKKPRGGVQYLWQVERPGLLANAMVLAGRHLFLAGPPDVADEEKTFDYVSGGDDALNRALRGQEAAWLGKQGAALWVLSADTGQKLAEHKMAALPVWDGMIAAAGRLYIATKDGAVVSMGPGR